MESLHELIGELNGRDITEGGLRGAAHEFAERERKNLTD
jgi:hydrogenase maturation factor